VLFGNFVFDVHYFDLPDVLQECDGLKWAYKLNSSSAGSRNLTSKGCMLKVNQLNQFYSHW